MNYPGASGFSSTSKMLQWLVINWMENFRVVKLLLYKGFIWSVAQLHSWSGSVPLLINQLWSGGSPVLGLLTSNLQHIGKPFLGKIVIIFLTERMHSPVTPGWTGCEWGSLWGPRRSRVLRFHSKRRMAMVSWASAAVEQLTGLKFSVRFSLCSAGN